MNCEEVRLSLEEREDAARLPEPARAHLASCPACAEYAKLFAPGGATLQEALAQPPDPAAWARVKAGLAEKIERSGKAKAPRARRERAAPPPAFWTPLRITVAAAAGVALAVGAYFLLHAPEQKNGTEVAQDHSEHGTPNAAASARLAKLQESVQKQYLLEELANLEGALQETANADAKSLAQDAELYVERLLALKAVDAGRAKEILGGIRSAQIARKLGDARKKLGPDAGESLTRPLDLAAEALGEAEQIAELDGGRDAN
ncbi:MAG: hypothetical protein HY291_03035 [Planctomycetes bacterium]|nr:hypothetical protein [Planctomycetota bacterium]